MKEINPSDLKKIHTSRGNYFIGYSSLETVIVDAGYEKFPGKYRDTDIDGLYVKVQEMRSPAYLSTYHTSILLDLQDGEKLLAEADVETPEELVGRRVIAYFEAWRMWGIQFLDSGADNPST